MKVLELKGLEAICARNAFFARNRWPSIYIFMCEERKPYLNEKIQPASFVWEELSALSLKNSQNPQ